MRNLLYLFAIAVFIFNAVSCQPTATAPPSATCADTPAATPSDAYRTLYGCVKAKDTAGIRRVMTKDTNAFVESVAGIQKQDVNKVYENGLTATTFAPNLPEIRDERIKDEFAKVEVWNEKDKRWEDLPFMKEEGSWKLAVGDDWKGTFKSPGKGRAQIEAEAANVNSNNLVPMAANVNSATNTAKIKRIEVPQPAAPPMLLNPANQASKK